jgi:hypothetical protein
LARRITKRPALKGTVLVARQVPALLALSPAYGQLTPDKQRQIASNMVKIGAYPVEPENVAANQLPGSIAIVPVGAVAGNFLDAVNFPAFVASLINGVFHAIVDSSIRQMEAYVGLLSKVAKTVERDTQSGDLRLSRN